jgi:glycosyltransferase involved in cell wall biosynthesis
MNGRSICVNVIVPAFNRITWLVECLASVLDQSYPNFQLIVIDDGSTPPLADQPALAEMFRDDRVRLIRSLHKGPTSARNLGLDAANRDSVLMLDSDDVLDRTGLEMLVGAGQEADVAVGGWADFDTSTGRRQVVLPRQRYSDPYANCVEQMWITGAALLRNVRMPRFNETRMPWEALEFNLDYLAEGRTAVYVNRVILNSRQHEEPNRLTIRHDHFEPHCMGRFFAEKKNQLKISGLLNEERIAALDKRILSCVHSLLRQGRERDAQRLFDKVSWDLMRNQGPQRVASFAWSSQVFGFLGAKAFIAANRMLGRG